MSYQSYSTNVSAERVEARLSDAPRDVAGFIIQIFGVVVIVFSVIFGIYVMAAGGRRTLDFSTGQVEQQGSVLIGFFVILGGIVYGSMFIGFGRLVVYVRKMASILTGMAIVAEAVGSTGEAARVAASPLGPRPGGPAPDPGWGAGPPGPTAGPTGPVMGAPTGPAVAGPAFVSAPAPAPSPTPTAPTPSAVTPPAWGKKNLPEAPAAGPSETGPRGPSSDLPSEPTQRSFAAPTEPGWVADPTGRHEYRFWDGKKYSARVGDGGVESTDPI